MRGRFSQLGRGVVAVMFVASLAAPAFARPREGERDKPPAKVVKVLQQFIRSLGDGLIIPRP